ncbi:MAG: M18 family aminopeptidase, partial [gamma proteobacterium symbiont of Bathyaustriella thionipta]|nr:M18 family aminopeptidase [gamma proteobacterium symbiont of Bathyaustriella thionipta]
MPNNDSTDHSLLDITHFNNDLFHFLDASPTPYHVVKNQIERLKSYGFQRLSESESWLLEKG